MYCLEKERLVLIGSPKKDATPRRVGACPKGKKQPRKTNSVGKLLPLGVLKTRAPLAGGPEPLPDEPVEEPAARPVDGNNF